MFKKTLSVLLIINLVVCSTMILPTQFVTALENETAQSTDGNESALISTLTVYFNSRTMTTADAITASLCEITNPGMPEDEIKRMNLWKNQGIISITNSYSIDYFEASDILGVAYVTESISYSYTDNIENQYVTHYIEFSYNEDGSAHILMDSYAEPLINFESCSYLPDYLLSLADNTIGNETATNDHVNTGDYAYDVAQIALTQVGYLEKATNSQLDHKTANAGTGNYTKYTRDTGNGNGIAWCAVFVAWCAQEAGLDIKEDDNYSGAVVPNEPHAPTMHNYYNELGLYHSVHHIHQKLEIYSL